MKYFLNLDYTVCKFNIALFLKSLMLLSPVLLLFYNENGLNAGDLFLCQGLFYIFAILFDIPVGYFSNTKSRRNILIFAFSMFIFISILWLLLKGFYIIVLGEIMYALVKVIFDSVPSAYMYDYLSQKNKSMSKYWGYSNFYMAFGIAVGSLIGAYLYSLFGSPFILIAQCFIMLVCIFLISTIPNIKIPRNANNTFKEKLNDYYEVTKDICKNKSVMYYIFYSGLLNALSYLFVLGFQPIMQNALFPIFMFGVITFICNSIRACSGVIVGKWLRNVSAHSLIIPLFVLYLIAFGCIFTILSVKNILFDFILMVIICLIIGVQIMFLILHICRLHTFVPIEKRGSLMTINNCVARLIPAIIFICSKLFMDNLGLKSLFSISFVVFIVLGSYMMLKAYKIK